MLYYAAEPGRVVARCGRRYENAGKRKIGMPGRFESEILEFERGDQAHFPPAGAIVCTGSSSMKGWRFTIEEDLAPLTVIPRGFGGSCMSDALEYVDRIVTPYKPRAVVLYEGDNDVSAGVHEQVIMAELRRFTGAVHRQLPQARIYVMSIKPSICRLHLWPRMKAVNVMFANECAGDQRLTYVDVASAMFDEKHELRKDLFQADDLHMNRAGYEIWRDALRPVLLEKELRYEKKMSQ